MEKVNKLNKILLLLLGILITIFLIKIVFAQSNCKAGDCPPDRNRNFGSGIWKDNSGNIYYSSSDCQSKNNPPNTPCSLATAQDLFNQKEKAVTKDIQDSMNEQQAKEFNKLMSERVLGVELEGDHIAYGKWDGENLVYGQNKFSKEILNANSIKKLQLNGNIARALNKNGELIFSTEGFRLVNPNSYNLAKKTTFSECSLCGSQSDSVFAGYPSTGVQGGGQAGQAEQQMLALVQQISTPLAQIMASNNKGKTTASSNNGKPSVTLDRGASAQFFADNNPIFSLAQNKPDEQARAVIDKNSVKLENANIMVPQQLAAITPTEEIKLVLNGEPGNDPSNPPETANEPQPIIRGRTSVYQITSYLSLIPKKLSPFLVRGLVSAQTESDNQIILDKHNLFVDGKDISTYALKTFNELEFRGQNLKFFSGNFEIVVNNQQTLVNRNLKPVPYGARKIRNELDSGNEFILQHYTNRKGEFYNDEKIVSISDIAVEHPKIEGLVIWKEREKMLR